MELTNETLPKRVAVLAEKVKSASDDARPGGILKPDKFGVFGWEAALLFSGSQDFMGSLNYHIFYISDDRRKVLQTSDGRLRIDLNPQQVQDLLRQASQPKMATDDKPYLVVLVVSGYGAPLLPENEYNIGNYYFISAGLYPGDEKANREKLEKGFRFDLTLSYAAPPYDYWSGISQEVQEQFLSERQPPDKLVICASTAPRMVIFAGHIKGDDLAAERKALAQDGTAALESLKWKEPHVAFPGSPLDPPPALERFDGFPGLTLRHVRPFATYGLMYEDEDVVALPSNLANLQLRLRDPGQQNSTAPRALPGTPQW